MRERLIELLDYVREHPEKLCPQFNSTTGCKGCKYEELDDCASDRIADYLLANGVIVPPCKVGDKVYIIANISRKIIECTVIGVWLCEGNCNVITDYGTIYNLSYGKTVFLTKEEAENALRKEDEGK